MASSLRHPAAGNEIHNGARTGPISPAAGADLSILVGRTWDGAMVLVRTLVCSWLLAFAVAVASDVQRTPATDRGSGRWATTG